jgi:hypothetical protein
MPAYGFTSSITVSSSEQKNGYTLSYLVALLHCINPTFTLIQCGIHTTCMIMDCIPGLSNPWCSTSVAMNISLYFITLLYLIEEHSSKIKSCIVHPIYPTIGHFLMIEWKHATLLSWLVTRILFAIQNFILKSGFNYFFCFLFFFVHLQKKDDFRIWKWF